MIETNVVETALEGLRPSLAEDGFELRVGAITESEVQIVLEAFPDACLDCLVPDDMLVAMLQDAITSEAGGADIGSLTLTKTGFEGLHE